LCHGTRKIPNGTHALLLDKFYEHAVNESLIMGRIVINEQGMEPLTDDEMARLDSTTTCEVCRKPFTKKNHKVMHHDHITGKYVGPTCNRYNLGLRCPNRKLKTNRDHGKTKR